MINGHVIISELDTVMCVVVSRENQALWGINWYQKMYNTTDQVLHKSRLL